MKKNLIISIISLIFILAFSITSFAAEETLSGKEKENIPETMEDISQELIDVTMTMPEISVIDNKLFFSAAINLGEGSIPISLSGEIFNSKQYEDSYTIKATDENNNFDVLNMQIIKTLLKEELLISDDTRNQNVLLLYLQPKNTEKMVLFEIPLEKLPIDLFSVIDRKNISDIEKITDEHWWLNVFSPSETYPVQTRASSGYTRVASVYHGVYLYTMDLYTFVNYNNFTSSGSFESGLRVNKQDYYYNGVHQGSGNFLSVYNCTGKVMLQNASGTNSDFITYVHYDTVSTQSTGGFTGSLSLSASFHGVGGSISWTPVVNVTSHTGGRSFSESDHVNAVSVPFIKPIRDAQNQYSMQITVRSGANKGNLKKIAVQYDFGVGYEGASGTLQPITVSTSGNYTSN